MPLEHDCSEIWLGANADLTFGPDPQGGELLVISHDGREVILTAALLQKLSVSSNLGEVAHD